MTRRRSIPSRASLNFRALLQLADGELRGLVSQEVKKREDIIGARVIAALQVGNAIDPIYMGRELSDLLHFSGPIQVVMA